MPPTPQTNGVPKTPNTPKSRTTPKVPKTPKTSGSQRGATTPKIPTTPKAPATPEAPEKQNTAIPEPPLHAAIKEGSMWEIRKLLKEGADPNEYNVEGRMPLHVSMLSGRQDMYTVVEALLAHDADVNAICEPEEEAPLHLVLKHAPADLAELVALRLIQNGADPELRDRSLRNAYDYALQHSYMQVMRVVEDTVPVNEAVHDLLDARVEVDARQLILAIQQGRIDDLYRCLGRGGNLNFIDPNGAGAIHYLVAVSPLNKAEVLQLLIDARVDIDLRTYEGDTALNLAIKNSKLRQTNEMIPVIELLLYHGCRIDLNDLDGKDALVLAEERDYHDVVDLLRNIRPSREIAWNIPIDSFNIVELVYLDYWEGLRERIEGANITELEEFVHQARINLDEEDEDGQTCIHWAVLRTETEGISDIIRLLAAHGAEVNAKSDLDETPLHLAADRGLAAAVKTLLSLGADDITFDDSSRTPVNRATLNRHTEIVKILSLHKQKRNSAAFEHVKDVGEVRGESSFIRQMETVPEEEAQRRETALDSTQTSDVQSKPNKKSAACVII